jgi:hypothetical protein
MSIISNTIGCGVGCASMIFTFIVMISFIIIGVSGYTILTNSSQGFLTQYPLAYLVKSGISLMITLIWTSTLIHGVLIVWRYGTWNEFFKEIIKLEQNKI